MDPNYFKAYRKKLLNTFKYTIDFLNSHDINWWCCGGTTIGAVRHRGMIPWDDDIDIYVTRKDYCKLISMRDEFDNEQYEVSHLSFSENAVSSFIKVIDKKTTIQAVDYLPIVFGVFVDIFPLDFSDEDAGAILKTIKEMTNCYDKYFEYIEHFSIGSMIKSITHPNMLRHQIRVNSETDLIKRNDYLNKALRLDDAYSNNVEGKKCFTMHGHNHFKLNYIFKNPKWFDGYEEMPFDSLIVRVPINYDEYLSYKYGDYMKMPSEKDRHPAHNIYYVNLLERLTLEEIVERKKRGENYVY